MEKQIKKSFAILLAVCFVKYKSPILPMISVTFVRRI